MCGVIFSDRVAIRCVVVFEQRLGRIGQSCTHIVWKNGSKTTSDRWRQMDPKPLVVMLAWVVGCVEQKKRLDERYYLVDLEHVNVAGINKVSMLCFHCNDSCFLSYRLCWHLSVAPEIVPAKAFDLRHRFAAFSGELWFWGNDCRRSVYRHLWCVNILCFSLILSPEWTISGYSGRRRCRQLEPKIRGRRRGLATVREGEEKEDGGEPGAEVGAEVCD